MNLYEHTIIARQDTSPSEIKQLTEKYSKIGQSHSGNVAAHDLAQANLLDILSSDYIPASLLIGAVKLGQTLNSLSKGLQSVTSAPADATGLTDRGRLSVGKRADIVRFRLHDQMPIVGSVFCGGLQVA